MKTIPITLGIARKGNASLFQGMTPAAQLELKQKIFERDNHTCQCCGFQAKKYQEVLALDEALGTKVDNLATTCIFCHQCFHMDKVAEMRSGVLIWLPEIAQADLHNIARALYVARISQGPMSETARAILDSLMTRREDVRNRLGTDDPYVLAGVFRDYIGRRHYAERTKKMEGVRLFPLDRRLIKEEDMEFNQFPQILAFWRSKDGPFGGKVPNGWIDFFKDTVRKSA
ncbi:MAG: type IVB secretion system protein IcmJDotN [Pseudobdellovibrionaceae bacterium]